MKRRLPPEEARLANQPGPTQEPETPEAQASGTTQVKRRKTMRKEAAVPGRSGAGDKGLKELKRIVSALQAGKLNERANAASFSGEWAEAFEAINSFAGGMNGLIGDMNAMSAAHDQGDIDAVIDAAKYPGDFGRMASGINTMVVRAHRSKEKGHGLRRRDRAKAISKRRLKGSQARRPSSTTTSKRCAQI